MIGWIIYDQEDALRNKSYIAWFIDEAKKQGLDLKLILRETLTVGVNEEGILIQVKGEFIALPQFVVVRTIEPIIQRIFESLHIPTFNSAEVSELANHKSKTYLAMKNLGIPLLPTLFIKRSSLPVTAPLPFPFVIKEARGRSGKQVYLIESMEDYHQTLPKINSKDLVFQSAKVQRGKDVRVFVIGKEIIAAVLRSNERDFRANFTLGGDAEVYELNVKEREIVEKIINHYSFGLVGIDFLIGEDGQFLFNEIEDVVGSRILSATTNINLLEKYVSFIKDNVESKINRAR